MDVAQHPEEPGPLPRTREAVDWWLRKWGRDTVVEGKVPLTRRDVERLIEVNGSTAEELALYLRNMSQINFGTILDADHAVQTFNLQGANLSLAGLQGAVLTGANLQDAGLWRADLQGAVLAEANLQGAHLMEANLAGAFLAEANLQGADLSGADLRESDLLEAKLQDADLSDADFRGASLTGVHLSPATNLEGAKWDKDYVSILERTGEYEDAMVLYRRLKEWHRGAGKLTIAGEFHYREEEVRTKAVGQHLSSEFSKEFKAFKHRVAMIWRQLRGDKGIPQLKE